MNTLTENYFDTLSDVLEAIDARLEGTKSKLVERDSFRAGRLSNGVPYGVTMTDDAALFEYKGRPTTRYAHATVCRLESGRYELTFYVL